MSGAGGKSKAKNTDPSNSSKDKFISLLGSGGLIFDTAVADDTLFNYRLNLGFGGWQHSFDDSDVKYRGFHYSFLNSFGFGTVRTPHLRFWLGLNLDFIILKGKMMIVVI